MQTPSLSSDAKTRDDRRQVKTGGIEVGEKKCLSEKFLCLAITSQKLFSDVIVSWRKGRGMGSAGKGSFHNKLWVGVHKLG